MTGDRKNNENTTFVDVDRPMATTAVVARQATFSEKYSERVHLPRDMIIRRRFPQQRHSICSLGSAIGLKLTRCGLVVVDVQPVFRAFISLRINVKKGTSANAGPHYQKLYARVTHIWGNRRSQPSLSAMKGPHPERTS